MQGLVLYTNAGVDHSAAAKLVFDFSKVLEKVEAPVWVSDFKQKGDISIYYKITLQ